MPTNDNCLFCKIASKKAPARVIYEDDKTAGFLDVQPRAKGHTLLVPKYHAATLADLPESEVRPLFSAVRSVADLLVKTFRADGLTIGINQGEASGQVVGHLHVHLLPRFKNDGGGAIQSVVNRPSADSLEDIQKKILNF